MTRRELRQAYWLNKELKMWERKLEELRYKAYPGAIPTDTDGIRGSKLSDRTGDTAAEIADTMAIIDGLRRKAERSLNGIHKHIDSIADSQLRLIVQYRCVEYMNWGEVGAKTGITGDAAKKMFYRAYPE